MKRGRSLPRLFGTAGLTLGALSAAGITASSLLLTATPAAAATCFPAGATGLTARGGRHERRDHRQHDTGQHRRHGLRHRHLRRHWHRRRHDR